MLSRKPQKAVHPTDPGQSGWWFLAPACGAVVGAAIPYLGTLGPKWAAACMALNAIGGITATTPQLREWLSARFHRQQITDTAGVLKNGIGNKYLSHKDLYSLRVHRSDRKDITDFVHRDIQDQLVEHLRNRIPVLIEGTSMAGKTRLAIETIRSQWPNTYCWFPLGPGDIEKLLNSNQQPPPESIIILDDLDRFLSNQSLTLGQLNRWVNNSCIIVATMMHSQYVKHSDRSNEKVVGWDVVNRFERLTLSPSLSTKELNDVRLTSYANQLSQIKNVGLGPLLGCAEAVRSKFADELKKHSQCGALIKAAADWRRIGLGPASRDQLTSLSLSHKNDVWKTVDWDDTWKEATRPINHTTPLLRQVGEDQWEVLDTIADEADWKISEQTFTALQNITLSAQQTRQSAFTMLIEGASPSSTNAMFQRAIDATPEIDATVLGAYAIFLETVQGDMDQAEQMYQQAIGADPHHATVLGAYAAFLETVRGDMDQAEQLYRRAIDADPHHANNLGNYAAFLETVRGDMDQAEQMYQQAIDADPHHARNLGTYANFLKNIRGDMDQAQQMYQQAIDADPTNARNLDNYANFLKNIRGDMDQAQQMYQQAITADPTNATVLGAYAIFLHTARGDMDQAHLMYQQAIDADPEIDATFLGAYAIFLHTVRGDMDQAHLMYQQAIDADPEIDATVLGAYAIFLHTVRGDMDQAQLMYQQAIDADPEIDATVLGTYAAFLKNIRGDMDQAQQMYQRAIDADPTNARNLANYAAFLHTVRGDAEQAKQMYQQATDADPTNATVLGAYANFLKNIRRDMDQAQQMYQQAITADPHHARNLGTYAIFLETVRGDMDQAQQMYQQAIDADPHHANNLGNYATFLHTVRGDMDQAEQMYQQAIDADPHHANNLGTYAQVLFVKADDMKAISLTKKAISFAGNDEKSLRAECHFYLFAHSPKHRKDSGGALKTLLADGVTTGDWSFEMNLERVRREEDPRLELLEAVAQALRDGDMSRLNAFEEWRDL